MKEIIKKVNENEVEDEFFLYKLSSYLKIIEKIYKDNKEILNEEELTEDFILENLCTKKQFINLIEKTRTEETEEMAALIAHEPSYFEKAILNTAEAVFKK